MSAGHSRRRPQVSEGIVRVNEAGCPKSATYVADAISIRCHPVGAGFKPAFALPEASAAIRWRILAPSCI